MSNSSRTPSTSFPSEPSTVLYAQYSLRRRPCLCVWVPGAAEHFEAVVRAGEPGRLCKARPSAGLSQSPTIAEVALTGRGLTLTTGVTACA